MTKVVLDTDIYSEIVKAIHPEVVKNATDYYSKVGYYTISAITVMEVVKGLHRVGRQKKLEQFIDSLSDMEILSFDRDSSELAGKIYADLQKKGQPIGRADPMIAAISLNKGFTLVTGNISHYRRISDLGYPLVLENWKNRDKSVNG